MAQNIDDIFSLGNVHERPMQLWFQRFSNGDKRLENEEGYERLSNVNNDQLKAIIDADILNGELQMNSTLTTLQLIAIWK